MENNFQHSQEFLNEKNPFISSYLYSKGSDYLINLEKMGGSQISGSTNSPKELLEDKICPIFVGVSG